MGLVVCYFERNTTFHCYLLVKAYASICTGIDKGFYFFIDWYLLYVIYVKAGCSHIINIVNFPDITVHNGCDNKNA